MKCSILVLSNAFPVLYYYCTLNSLAIEIENLFLVFFSSLWFLKKATVLCETDGKK